MAVVYLNSDYGKLKRENFVLKYVNAEGESALILTHKLTALVISAKVTLTGEALRLLMEHQVDTLFVNPNGEYAGKLVFSGNNAPEKRRMQYARSGDAQFALALAKRFITAKMTNELVFAQRIARKSVERSAEALASIEEALAAIKQFKARAEYAETVDELRGLEGMAAKHYFAVFRGNFNPGWADFSKRSNHPPRSNGNAALSYLYTLLSYRVRIAIEAAGLDAGAGFLHQMGQRAPSLVYDLIEEFRTPVADTLCCTLFNHRILVETDFERAKDAVYLSHEGRKKVIAAFENKINSTVSHEGVECSYNNVIIRQAQALAQFITGAREEYQGYIQK